MILYLTLVFLILSLSEQINLRGLDGIQGPVYVGTGCVFNRTALYGYEPPVKPKHKKLGLLSSLCGGSRSKSSKSSKKGSKKKKSSKHVDPTVPIFSLEDIEEGVEGMPVEYFYSPSICISFIGIPFKLFLPLVVYEDFDISYNCFSIDKTKRTTHHFTYSGGASTSLPIIS